jgi:hypothetical protein
MSIKHISADLEINRNTITSIIRLFKNRTRINVVSTRSTRQKILTAEMKMFLREEVDMDVSIKHEDLHKNWESFNIFCSITTLIKH